MRRALTLILVPLALALAPAGALAAAASLPDIEDEVMCVTCRVPLNTAQSPQADRERAYIRDLIRQGKDKEQIKAALVSEYGKEVLATPSDDGFGRAAYIVPIVVIVLLAAGLAVALPRRRRRGAGEGSADDDVETPEISAEDAARLDADLARFDA